MTTDPKLEEKLNAYRLQVINLEAEIFQLKHIITTQAVAYNELRKKLDKLEQGAIVYGNPTT